MGTVLKFVATVVAVILALPLAAIFHLAARVHPARRDAVFQGCTQLLALGPGLPGDYVRRAFLWMTARRCALTSSIGFGTIFASPDVEVGDGVYIGPYCVVGRGTIGTDTMLGTGVHLIPGGRAHGSDRLDVPMRHQTRSEEPVRIGRDCWIGNGAVVMADVGDHAIVGAGAVVPRPVGAYHVVAGNPAKLLRDRRGRPAPLSPG